MTGAPAKRGIWAAAASTVSAAKESTLSASFFSSRASESPAATRLALHRIDAVSMLSDRRSCLTDAHRPDAFWVSSAPTTCVMQVARRRCLPRDGRQVRARLKVPRSSDRRNKLCGGT